MSQNEYGSNPYYQNGGAGGGGGYLTGGGSPSSVFGSPGGPVRRGAASHSLRPLTIKQVLDATQAHTDAEWMVEENEVGQITLVAQVMSIQSQTTNNVYWLDDGTGRIEARHWIDSTSEEDVDKWGGVTENIYVRVAGAIKTFGNKRYINATNLRPSTDPHELYFHLLEAMYVTTVFKKGPPPGSGAQGQQVNGISIKGGPSNASAYNPQSSNAGNANKYGHLPKVQQDICMFIRSQPPNEEGVHVAAIARAVGGDAHIISEALDKLMDDGAVFSTIDESHFQLSE